jgi:ribosome maturation protein Sdo1
MTKRFGTPIEHHIDETIVTEGHWEVSEQCRREIEEIESYARQSLMRARLLPFLTG